MGADKDMRVMVRHSSLSSVGDGLRFHSLRDEKLTDIGDTWFF